MYQNIQYYGESIFGTISNRYLEQFCFYVFCITVGNENIYRSSIIISNDDFIINRKSVQLSWQNVRDTSYFIEMDIGYEDTIHVNCNAAGTISLSEVPVMLHAYGIHYLSEPEHA